jgi:hypothetical protein
MLNEENSKENKKERVNVPQKHSHGISQRSKS